LREKGQVSKIEGERLLSFTNNSGPLFIVGAVATGMFKMPSIGLFLLVSHILAGLTVGIIFRFYGSKSIKSNKNMKNNSTNNGYWQRFKKEAFGNDKKNNSFGELFGEAIRNSVLLMLSIGGFIIFFSVVINLLIDTGFINYISTVISYVFSPIGLTKETINSLLCGFFEITTGTNMISKATDLSLISKLSFASLVIGWAGLSVHSQVSSIISKSDLSIKPYLIGKCLHGIIACIYSFTALKLLGNLTFDLSVFANTGEIKIVKWYNSLIYSCKNLAFIILLFLLIYILIYFSNKLSRNKASYNNKTL
ncbi:MAG: nucleoside recognition domain-containing protein, partial [Bacillota bacterium]|nr:nucleoside recognition domain-containing protein [Bacillota bacterium]